MCRVKDASLDCEILQDKIDYLKDCVDQQRETISRLESEKRLLESKLARKEMMLKGLKLNNSALTLERNNALDELSKIKAMNMYEFGAKYNTSEQQEEAGRAFAREMLGR